MLEMKNLIEGQAQPAPADVEQGKTRLTKQSNTRTYTERETYEGERYRENSIYIIKLTVDRRDVDRPVSRRFDVHRGRGRRESGTFSQNIAKISPNIANDTRTGM